MRIEDKVDALVGHEVNAALNDALVELHVRLCERSAMVHARRSGGRTMP
jgi:hypothetical protein